MELEHSRAFLFSVLSVNGTKQDIVVDAAQSLFTNRLYYMNFLAEVLSYKNCNNKLELSLYLLFTSKEIVGVI